MGPEAHVARRTLIVNAGPVIATAPIIHRARGDDGGSNPVSEARTAFVSAPISQPRLKAFGFAITATWEVAERAP